MPLLDHFHRPLSEERHWESFHSMWASEIAAGFNRGLLPKGYFAECPVHVGGIEVDVGTLERLEHQATLEEGNGGVAVQVEAPAIVFTMPAVFPDSIEVQVFETEAGPTLVGAIELVSPGNKDRPETRRAFAAKCAAYLQAGVGLIVIDIVTARQANLHNELIDLLGHPDSFRFAGIVPIYSVAYRPYRAKPAGEFIDVRAAALGVDRHLPTMPLCLRRGPTIPVAFEGTYMEARSRSQL